MSVKKIIGKIVDRLLDVCLVLILLAVLYVLALVFLYATFRIPSRSMYPTLEEGDRVLVWKPVLGARLFDVGKTLDEEQTAIYRLPGLRKVKRNDVLVFNFPHSNDWSRIEMHILKYYIKRCIGLPGDTLSICGGMFRVSGVDGPLGNVESQLRIGRTAPEDFPKGTYRAFPFDSLTGWNIRDFGPLYIPCKGGEVALDRMNVLLYRKPIEWEQGEKLVYRNDSVLLGDSLVRTYRFRKNYYFVAGDNGWNSQDSRYWGLLPEEYIVGRAARICNSTDPLTGKTRWDRVWKKIE